MPNYYSKSGKRAFTLIEMMVSVSIFSIVMVIAAGAIVSINDANRKAQGVRALVDNLNFAIEDMTRNLRTGSDIECQNCTTGGPTISFSPQGRIDRSVSYEFVESEGTIYKTVADGSGMLERNRFIAPEIKVHNMRFFFMEGDEQGYDRQPLVVLSISGEFDIAKEKLRTNFNLQTVISRRGM